MGELLRNLSDPFSPHGKDSLQCFECRGGLEGQLGQAGVVLEGFKSS